MKQQAQSKAPRAGAHAAAPADGWRRELRDAIVSRVVPRLAEPAGSGRAIDDEQVRRFAELALAGSVARLAGEVEARRAEGRTVEALTLDLLAPAARRLGDLWLADRIGFVDVTAGVGRLQALVRALGPAFDAPGPVGSAGRRMLLAAAPGEQHVFGVSVAAAFFRRAGWAVTFEPRIAFDDLLSLAGAERFAAIGLSAAGDGFVEALPAQITALRRASPNRDVVVLAGGPAFLADPDLGRRVGADAAPRDAAEAVRVAGGLSSARAAAR